MGGIQDEQRLGYAPAGISTILSRVISAYTSRIRRNLLDVLKDHFWAILDSNKKAIILTDVFQLRKESIIKL